MGFPLEICQTPLSIAGRNVGDALAFMLAERHDLDNGFPPGIHCVHVLFRYPSDVADRYAAQQLPAAAEHSPYLPPFKCDVLDLAETGYIAAEVDNEGVLFALVDTCSTPDDLVIQGD